MMPKYLKDLIERTVWTAAQAGLAVLAVNAADWENEWAIAIAAGLAVLKGIVARQVGDSNSASTVPSV